MRLEDWVEVIADHVRMIEDDVATSRFDCIPLHVEIVLDAIREIRLERMLGNG